MTDSGISSVSVSHSMKTLAPQALHRGKLKDWPYIAIVFPFHTQKQVRRHYYAIRKTWTTNTSVSVLPEPVPVEECKHEFMEDLKNRVNALETQLTLTTNRLQDIIKKYSN